MKFKSNPTKKKLLFLFRPGPPTHIEPTNRKTELASPFQIASVKLKHRLNQSLILKKEEKFIKNQKKFRSVFSRSFPLRSTSLSILIQHSITFSLSITVNIEIECRRRLISNSVKRLAAFKLRDPDF